MLTLFLFRLQRYHLPQVGQGVFDQMAWNVDGLLTFYHFATQWIYH